MKKDESMLLTGKSIRYSNWNNGVLVLILTGIAFCPVCIGTSGDDLAFRLNILVTETEKIELQYMESTDSLAYDNFHEVHNLANSLLSLRDYQGAIHHARRALALDPGLAPARRNLARALANNGQREEALSSLREGLGINPNDSKTRDLLQRLSNP